MTKEIRDRLRAGCGHKHTGAWALALGALLAIALYCAFVLSPQPTSSYRLQVSGLKDYAERHEKQVPRPLVLQARNDPMHPSILEHLFVCVTFHWDVLGLTLLRQAVTTISNYKTTVTLCIISNKPELLQMVIKSWEKGAEHWVCGTNDSLIDPLHLAFVHRRYMELAFTNTEYTSFMYIEHDMNIPWPQLLGWAADTPLLEPLGFQRGFYRVEPSEQTGLPGLTDQISRLNITEHEQKLHITYRDTSGQVKEKHFLQLPNPYFAAWIATRSQLARFLPSKQWDERYTPWAVRAMAACGLQFVDVPDGFFSAAVVPYDPGEPRDGRPPALHPLAAIEHMSNKYCSANTHHGEKAEPIEDHLGRQGAELHCTVPAQSFLYA